MFTRILWNYFFVVHVKESELNKHKKDRIKEARTATLLKQFEKENAELRNHIFSLQGEVYGARLAAKYLDKELAGRCVC